MMKEVFKPNFYTSTYYLLVGVMMIIAFPLFLVYFSNSGGEKIVALILVGIVCIPLCLLTCFYIGIYHTISYEIYEEEITLRCGLFSSKIQYKEIKKIKKIDDLGYAPVGIMRLPKFLLHGVYFSKYGWITMYATSYKNVLLIETDKKLYGITPSNEEDFLRILNERLKR